MELSLEDVDDNDVQNFSTVTAGMDGVKPFSLMISCVHHYSLPHVACILGGVCTV